MGTTQSHTNFEFSRQPTEQPRPTGGGAPVSGSHSFSRSTSNSGVRTPNGNPSSSPSWSPSFGQVPPSRMGFQSHHTGSNAAAAAGERGGGTSGGGGGGGAATSANSGLDEQYRLRGNECYKQGFYEKAAFFYSKAIDANPSRVQLHTNRSLALIKVERYAEAVEDARHALALDDESVKGHYLLGKALTHIGQVDDGLKKLQRAKNLDLQGREREMINLAIFAAKLMLSERHEVACAERERRLEAAIETNPSVNAATKDDLREVLAELTRLRGDKVLPPHLCCSISMSLMRDPVVTPSGTTYERSFIESHIRKNGPTDPVSRERCELSQLHPNRSIVEATEAFLETNPWAYSEFV
eukprot:GHVU01224850.1.p1 GENE.GHVU01224850.1~~GHVU01224850.1.p1  ORF type:complete len:367 (-),score=53.54 GHVU01224850.1:113-1177(-)